MSVFLTWLVTEYMSVGPKGLMATGFRFRQHSLHGVLSVTPIL